MAINYKVSRCKNPNGADDVVYYSNKASKTSDYSFDDLANLKSQNGISRFPIPPR